MLTAVTEEINNTIDSIIILLLYMYFTVYSHPIVFIKQMRVLTSQLIHQRQHCKAKFHVRLIAFDHCH
jgi:hypothetical protein